MAMVALLEEEVEPSDEEFNSDDSYNAEDKIEHSDHDTESELDEHIDDEINEMEGEYSVQEVAPGPSGDAPSMPTRHKPENYYGKKQCFTWSSMEPNLTKTPARNIMKIKLPALGPNAKSLGTNPSIEDVWVV